MLHAIVWGLPMIIITPGLLTAIGLGMLFGPAVIAILEAPRYATPRPKRPSDGVGRAMALFIFLFGVGIVLVLFIAHLRGVPIH